MLRGFPIDGFRRLISHYEVKAVGRQAQGGCSERRNRGLDGDLGAVSGRAVREGIPFGK